MEVPLKVVVFVGDGDLFKTKAITKIQILYFFFFLLLLLLLFGFMKIEIMITTRVIL